MILTYDELVKGSPPALERAGAVLIKGTDDFLLQDASRRVLDALAGGGAARTFNEHRMVCTKDTVAGAVIGLCEELPVLEQDLFEEPSARVGRKVVVLEGVQAMAASQRQSLGAYLPRKPAATVLVVTAQDSGGGWARKAAKPKGRTKTAKSEPEPKSKSGRLKQPQEPAVDLLEALDRAQDAGQAVVVEATLSDAGKSKWAAARASAAGVAFSPDGLRLLLSRAGLDFWRLGHEIDKLAAFVGPHGAAVSRGDVETLIARPPDAKIWDLGDAVAERDSGRALAVFRDLLEEGFHPLAVLGSLHKSLRLLFVVKLLAARDLNAAGITEAIGEMARRAGAEFKALPFQVQLALRRHDAYSRRELRRAFDWLVQADLEMKRGKDPAAVMELLLAGLCHAAQSGRGAAR